VPDIDQQGITIFKNTGVHQSGAIGQFGWDYQGMYAAPGI
jgi:hypothetical protein